MVLASQQSFRETQQAILTPLFQEITAVPAGYVSTTSRLMKSICDDVGSHLESSRLPTRDIPLSLIVKRPDLFQNRDHDFSQDTVDGILTAIEIGEFFWYAMDPIKLWRDPKSNELILLAGFSRTEAFSRANIKWFAVDGKDFSAVPSVIFEWISFEQAQHIALTSNNLSTPERLIERAKFYRKFIDNSVPLSHVELMARRFEKKNAADVISYSFLAPRGKMADIYRQFSEWGEDILDAKKMAQWIGKTRRRFPELTDSHEDEITDWLLWGVFREFSSYDRYMEKFEILLAKARKTTEFGVIPEYLNLAGQFNSTSEVDANIRLKELSGLYKRLKAELTEFRDESAKILVTEKLILKKGWKILVPTDRTDVMKLLTAKEDELLMLKEEIFEIIYSLGKLARNENPQTLFDSLVA